MICKSDYIRNLHNFQTKSTAIRLKRATLLAKGCRGPISQRRIVYLATPIDQYHNPNYYKVRCLVARRFHFQEWAIFEPACCNWTTGDWLKAWPRLVRWIDVLVIWPRTDGSVGKGVFQEARDIGHLGKPIFILDVDGRLKKFNGFCLYKKRSLTHYARVKSGKLVRGKKISVAGAKT